MQHGRNTIRLIAVGRKIGKHRFFDERVVPGVGNLFGIRVTDFHGAIHPVLKYVLLLGCEIVQFEPEEFAIGRFFHLVIGVGCPIVEVADHINEVFSGSFKHQGCFGLVVRVVVDAFSHPRGQRSNSCVGSKQNVMVFLQHYIFAVDGCGDSNAEIDGLAWTEGMRNGRSIVHAIHLGKPAALVEPYFEVAGY